MALDQVIRRPTETLPPTATCTECAAVMRAQNIGAIVVSQDGHPLGIVTDRDLVTRVLAEGRDPTSVKLGDIMSPDPAFLSDRRSIDEAVATMRELGVRRLPVVDDEGKLEGMLSMDDLLMLIAGQVRDLGETIRRELLPPAR